MYTIDLRADKSENIPYNFRTYPIYVREALLSSYLNYEAAPHWHDDLEFLLVLSGEMSYNVNGEVLVLHAGEGIYVNSRQLHHGFSKERNECEFICVVLHPLLLCITREFEQDYVLPLLENPNLAHLKLTDRIPWQKEILQFISDAHQMSGEKNAPLHIVSLFLKTWTLLHENIGTLATPKVQNADLFLLKTMMSFVQKHFREKITLADIAASGAVGQSKCCKLFSHYIQCTPNAYLIRYRLEKSLWYLENTTDSITEIAQNVGFSGSSYFAETFQKYFHQSPSARRKSVHSKV